MSDRRPILVIDFDGVVHKYTSPWVDALTIADGVVPGFFDWAYGAQKHFKLAIYSSRSSDPAAVEAMKTWLVREHSNWLRETGTVPKLGAGQEVLDIEFPTSKPPAFLSIDDRAVTFTGSWSELDPEALRTFKPWNKKPRLLPAPQPA